MRSSIFIHEVVDIDVVDIVMDVQDLGPVAVTHYYITTKDGSKIDIAIFHGEEEKDAP
jgi:hypothetical protein